MTIEIRGTYNRVDRALGLDAMTITGSQEIQDYLAVHISAQALAQPLIHVEAICEALQSIFGDTLWRSDVVPVINVPMLVEPTVVDVPAEIEALKPLVEEAAEPEPPVEYTPRRSRRR